MLSTSESVSRGHPDKVADQISDAVLDACIAYDPFCRVDCETLVGSGLIVVSGQITASYSYDISKIVKATLLEIGYDPSAFQIIENITRQSPDIAQAVGKSSLRAGDQGIMIGYATNEEPNYMPTTIDSAHKILQALDIARRQNKAPFLGLDAKAQVTCSYNDSLQPDFYDTIVVSTQHTADISQKDLNHAVLEIIRPSLRQNLITNATRFIINPSGRFVIGGPDSDTGITGRKLLVDSYGPSVRHGGGAFSGKDPTKVDRSASYMARFLAKNIVASGLADRCEIELVYAIGMEHPLVIELETFGTEKVEARKLLQLLCMQDLAVSAIIEKLDLRRPIYTKTAFGGHFGREEFSWEKIDKDLVFIS